MSLSLTLTTVALKNMAFFFSYLYLIKETPSAVKRPLLFLFFLFSFFEILGFQFLSVPLFNAGEVGVYLHFSDPNLQLVPKERTQQRSPKLKHDKEIFIYYFLPNEIVQRYASLVDHGAEKKFDAISRRVFSV